MDPDSTVRATSLDHIVLRVADPEVSVTWYSQRLGLVPERLEEWRAGEVLFPSVRVDATTVIDLLAGAPGGVDHEHANLDHVALVVEGVDLDELADSVDFDVVGGPSPLWGARGSGRGLYVRDPDGNTVELRTYP